ncbi:hypothetical protein CF319_g8137 [Tilletia indica]|uniref:Ecp2 effector protein domain-containing protein n=2 Tax=Tilletia TaxID=13289 RepID=A0A8X7T517_9BASI|nr:hypothetical protein CF327_g1579 [Tilletia walkeri]KAE8215985.1 hypothetical protein CF326_g9700 [Tilletia indica]KAE8217872.1 hypothetical protein CF319_g8137 [Tilletia indica]KAE8239419.1 hypothetical protein A4X13_0g8216 [Tilletia indica]KAE8267903.1 hypothetical protein A4X09_0g4441 [Tilletia walkeri]
MFAFAPFIALSVLALNVLADRNTDFPACDTPNPPKVNKTVTGVATPFEISDEAVFYLKPGVGSCGVNYTDSDFVACLAPGWMGSAYHSHCGALVAIADAETGKQVIAKALDTCGAVADSTFDCGDIYLSKIAFEDLGGNTTLGRLTSNVTWNFIADDAEAGGSNDGAPKTCASKKRGMQPVKLPRHD